MIAMTADFATVWPNVGPIDVELGVSAKPNFAFSALVIFVTCVGPRFAVEIWKRLPLLFLSFWTFWTFASPCPFCVSTWRTALSSTFCVSATLIRVPDSKSMPKLMPFAPSASAQTSRIVPDALKNHFDAPM
jgi:thiol-disulfide isomerase/thioredoxin